jgi:hypothetical protein
MRPRYVRIYDNGGATADRYTVVYTRKSDKYDGVRWYQHVGMSAQPYHPQGVCQHGFSSDSQIDYPRYSHLGRKITWDDLPTDCQSVVAADYRDRWGGGGWLA